MKNKLFYLSLVIFAFTLTGCSLLPSTQEETSSSSETIMDKTGEANKDQIQLSYIDVSPQEAKELMDSNSDLVVIDVSPHYDEGHLPGAVSYYLGDGSLDAAIPNLDKDDTYLVYCHVDSVSIAGAQKLIDAGFEKVYRLEGNYSAWVKAGFEIEK